MSSRVLWTRGVIFEVRVADLRVREVVASRVKVLPSRMGRLPERRSDWEESRWR